MSWCPQELASLAACKQNHLSKVFLEGLRTHPMEEEINSFMEAEQTTAGLAMSSLARSDTAESMSPTRAILNSNSVDKQAFTWEWWREQYHLAWPGMLAYQQKRAATTSCDKNTPSQPSAS
jgi:hypothetical protein